MQRRFALMMEGSLDLSPLGFGRHLPLGKDLTSKEVSYMLVGTRVNVAHVFRPDAFGSFEPGSEVENLCGSWL
jgi:hypothetical protein